MDEAEEESWEVPSLEVTDPELRQLLGLFDVPAFARRGQDVEYSLSLLSARCERERASMLGMVHLRLRQWASAVAGPGEWTSAFAEPIDALWTLTGADPPTWSHQAAPRRNQRETARNLVASLTRFNRRWFEFMTHLDLDFVNKSIDQYNTYYLLEKECYLGSARLAARHYEPRPRVSREILLSRHPLLPVPCVITAARSLF
jgi:hypothetical protein